MLLGAPVAVAALIAVPLVAVAASGPSEAEVAACGETVAESAGIAQLAEDGKDCAQSAVADNDIDAMFFHTQSLMNLAMAVKGLDTSFCDTVAPSFAPAVAASVEAYTYLSAGLGSAWTGSYQTGLDGRQSLHDGGPTFHGPRHYTCDDRACVQATEHEPR